MLATATTPVLLVRAGQDALPDAPCPAGAPVLVALDGSALAEAALPGAARLADDLVGPLLLLRAVPQPDLAFGPDAPAAPLLAQELAAGEADARAYLARLAERRSGHGRRVLTEVRVGTPVAAIAAAGHEHGAGLIALGTHGLTGLRRAVLGSVADGVVQQGNLPVLLVRPPAPGE